MVTHSELIEVPIGTVWENLLLKIEHPEHFVPGVSNVVIREKTDEYVVRAMDLTLPGKPTATVVERITHAPHWVKFEMLDHPVYVGHVDNVAERVTEDMTLLTFSIHWTEKETGKPFELTATVKEAVQKTAEYIQVRMGMGFGAPASKLPIEVVMMGPGFQEYGMPCVVGTEACTHPTLSGLITIKKGYKQHMVCEACFNHMVATGRWVKGTW